MSQPPYSNDPPPQQPYGEQQPGQQPYGQQQSHQQPYQQQPYSTHGSSGAGSNAPAIAALITGIIALLLSWIPGINLLGFLLAIVAIVTGVIGMKKAGQPGGSGKGLAIGGLVTGILAILVTFLVYAGLAAIFNNADVQQQLEELEQQTQ